MKVLYHAVFKDLKDVTLEGADRDNGAGTRPAQNANRPEGRSLKAEQYSR